MIKLMSSIDLIKQEKHIYEDKNISYSEKKFRPAIHLKYNRKFV